MSMQRQAKGRETAINMDMILHSISKLQLLLGWLWYIYVVLLI